MNKFPLRRAQLITPFGVGAMITTRDGTSVISAGLDHWFEREDGNNDGRAIDISEYQFEEWRLQQLLGVNHFRLPPDFRPKRPNDDSPNSELTIPFLRFPRWHFCPKCKYLTELPLTVRGKQKCQRCSEKKKTGYLAQVPFVAMCEHGHIQDFPWREWVHSSINPSCQKDMKLIATGGASLSAQKVVCDCGASRTLAQITIANPDGTTELSRSLDHDGHLYLCQGQRPWLGTSQAEGCGKYLRGSPRGASNVYFADIRSAIYLPRGDEMAPPDLVELLEEPPLSTLVRLLSSMNIEMDVPAFLRGQHRALLQPYSDEQIKSAFEIIRSQAPAATNPNNKSANSNNNETDFRRAECRALRIPRSDTQLTIEEVPLARYEPFMQTFFSRIMLIPRLRETRALAGFTRVFAENDQSLSQRQSLLWKSPPKPQESWLPAYKVYGEGIFLELNETKLREWEKQQDVQQRVQILIKRYQLIQQNRRLRNRPIGPRFLLIHTLAHLLMNRLTFECGYSSAALRERLYVSDDSHEPMAGILIYTAAGDVEGTLGGLVRMGKPGYLEPVMQHAIEGARWCSVDPVCMEIGASGGQGPDSCNLAACHNCALVPETACEEFNRFLDRAMVIGDLKDSQLGFFGGFQNL